MMVCSKAAWRWFCRLAPLLLLATSLVSAREPVGGSLDVSRLDGFMREQVERHRLPGLAVAVVEGDQIVHLAGYGTTAAGGPPVTPQTPFVLASVTKPITALAIMQLVEAGRVELDAPVQRYLPGFRVADSAASRLITVRHLLQHTSGVPERGCIRRTASATLEQFVVEWQTIELASPPGTRHYYCSGNYNVLGRIIEVVSGRSYADYIEQHLFAPLAMRNSVVLREGMQREGAAQGHRLLFGVLRPFTYPVNTTALPAGFVSASAQDMAHFLVAQLNGGRFGDAQLLSPTGIDALHAPGFSTSATTTYGLGWRTGTLAETPAVYHHGDHPNFHSVIFFQPSTRRGAVLLANVNSIPALMTAFPEIEGGIARLLAGQEPQPAPLTLPSLYLILDAALGCLLALTLWPLLRLGRWYDRWRQHVGMGGRRPLSAVYRPACELAAGVALLLGGRLLADAVFGTTSWSEVLLVVPDLGAWLWLQALLLILTGGLRLALLARAHREASRTHG